MQINAQLDFQYLMDARTKLVKTECSKRTSQPAVNSNAMYALEVGIVELVIGRDDFVFLSPDLWCGARCTRPWPPTGCTTCCSCQGRTSRRLRRSSRIIQGNRDGIASRDDDYYRQADHQGRVVAPKIPLSHILSIASKKDARLLLIVRHPFDR